MGGPSYGHGNAVCQLEPRRRRHSRRRLGSGTGLGHPERSAQSVPFGEHSAHRRIHRQTRAGIGRAGICNFRCVCDRHTRDHRGRWRDHRRCGADDGRCRTMGELPGRRHFLSGGVAPAGRDSDAAWRPRAGSLSTERAAGRTGAGTGVRDCAGAVHVRVHGAGAERDVQAGGHRAWSSAQCCCWHTASDTAP